MVKKPRQLEVVCYAPLVVGLRDHYRSSSLAPGNFAPISKENISIMSIAWWRNTSLPLARYLWRASRANLPTIAHCCDVSLAFSNCTLPQSRHHSKIYSFRAKCRRHSLASVVSYPAELDQNVPRPEKSKAPAYWERNPQLKHLGPTRSVTSPSLGSAREKFAFYSWTIAVLSDRFASRHEPCATLSYSSHQRSQSGRTWHLIQQTQAACIGGRSGRMHYSLGWCCSIRNIWPKTAERWQPSCPGG